MENTMQKDDIDSRDFAQNISENDNQENQKSNINEKSYNNQNKDKDKENSKKNDLIDDDINIEMNNFQDNNQTEKNPENIKREKAFENTMEFFDNFFHYKTLMIEVYTILLIHLLIIVLFIFLVQRDLIKSFFDNRPIFSGFLHLISFLVLIYIIILLDKEEDLRIKTPEKYIMLLIITLFMSFTCGFYAVRISFPGAYFFFILLIIATITQLIIFKFSGLYINDYLSFFFMILSQIAGFIVMFFILDFSISILEIICYLFFTLMFGLYLIEKDQLDRKKIRISYSEHDFIYAFLEIYLDILLFFKIIVQLFLMLIERLRN